MAEIHAKCFTHPRPWSEHEFFELIGNDTTFLCALDHGFALGRVAGPEVELLTIAVEPTHRRQGFAQQLMNSFETRARENGASDAFLEVAETNEAAIALYHRFGFIEAGKRKDYYASPKGAKITALVMTKSL
jgi:ribosomal-protein-alanine N-acetyltransferase